MPDLPPFPGDEYAAGAIDDAKIAEEGRTLGEGAFGKVVASTHLASGQAVAIKKMRWMKGKMEPNVRREYELNKSFEHPAIVGALGLYCDDRYLFLVQQQVVGSVIGDSSDAPGNDESGRQLGGLHPVLAQILKDGESVVKEMLRDVLDALVVMHARHIAHLDLKFENIMQVEGGGYKLIDFGLARSLETKMTGMFGTPFLCPPQMFRKEDFGVEADMWQMGCVTYKLLAGYLPFYHEGRVELAEQVEACDLRLDSEEFAKVSDDMKDLVTQMLTKDPDARIDAAAARAHPALN